METKEAISVLKTYNKWRRGKGKKYSQPGMPLDVVKIGEAIDFAIEHLGYRISPEDFITIVTCTEHFFKQNMKILIAEQKANTVMEALRSAKKVKTRILKRQSK